MVEDTRDAEQPDGSWLEIFTGRVGVYTFVLSLGTGLFAINQFVVATIMPAVVDDLGGLDYYTWAFSLFAMGAIMGAASAGPLRDALGVRWSYAGAGLVLAVGLAGAAMATDMPTLVGFRLVQGVGGGALASQAYGLVSVIYPAHLRGRVLTVISTLWGLATVAGPGFGAFFAEPGLWRGAFWSLVPIALLFMVLVLRYIESAKGDGRFSEIPYWRLSLFGLAVLLVSATSLSGQLLVRCALVVGSVILMALAFVRDAKAERSMFPRQTTLINTELGATYWIIFLVSVCLAFVNTYTTFYLQALHGMTPFAAGYFFAIQSFMWTASALVVATIPASRESMSIVAGLAVMVIAALGISFTVETGPVIGIAIAIGLSGAGIGLMNNPAIQRAMAVAPKAELHIAGASVQTMRNIGISFGAGLSGMVASAGGLVDGAGPEIVAVAMRWVYFANIIFALLGLAVALWLMLGHRPKNTVSTTGG